MKPPTKQFIEDVIVMLLCILAALMMTMILTMTYYIPTDFGPDPEIPPNAYAEAWKIRNEPIEHLIAIDKETGVVLYHSTGNATSVSPPDQYAYLSRESIVIHNHPSPNGLPAFSKSDIGFFIGWGCEEIWAVTDTVVASYNSDGELERRRWSDIGYGRQNKRIQDYLTS